MRKPRIKLLFFNKYMVQKRSRSYQATEDTSTILLPLFLKEKGVVNILLMFAALGEWKGINNMFLSRETLREATKALDL